MIKQTILGITCLVPFSIQAVGVLSYGQFQRINTPLDRDVDNQYIQFDFDDRREKGRWDMVYNGSVRRFTGDRGFLYSLPEAYVSRHIGRNEYTVGRKIVEWEPNDRFWAMGEVNPLKNFNLLETDREGLFGFHYKRKAGNWSFMLFASMINVPQVNPTFSNSKGIITGKNEWSNPPPQAVRFRGNDVPVFYDVIYPDVAEIALQEAAAFKVDHAEGRHKISVFGGYKPEPGIRIVATGYYEQFEQERAVVLAKPFVNHQTFYGTSYSADLFKGVDSHLSAHGSYMGVLPERGTDTAFDQFDSLKIQPVYERISYSNASLKWRSRFFQASLNGLYLIEGGSTNTNVFAKKPRWQQAIGADFTWSLTDSLSWTGDYKYDLKTRDMGLLSRVRYQVTKHVGLGVGAQLLDSPDDNSFWAPYRSNDTFIGEFRYIF